MNIQNLALVVFYNIWVSLNSAHNKHDIWVHIWPLQVSYLFALILITNPNRSQWTWLWGHSFFMNNYRTDYLFSLHNPLMPQLTAHCTLQKTGILNCHPLPCTFRADDFRWCYILILVHPTAVKYISYHIISYHIISYHIISYHIPFVAKGLRFNSVIIIKVHVKKKPAHELKCISYLDNKHILPKYNIYNMKICSNGNLWLEVGFYQFYLELLVSFGTELRKVKWNVAKITLTGQTFECSAIYDPTFSFFLDRDIQSSNASRACWPMPPSRWTKGISRVKITNLQP
jgi:hypothetical protein